MGAGEYITIDNGSAALAAEAWGVGERGIVLLHPGVADRRIWRSMAPLIQDLGRCVAYDRRGYGESPASENPSLEQEMQDLEAVIAHFGFDSVWLVGNSMGGRLAVDFALAHPELVHGLFLVAPGFSGTPDIFPMDPDAMSIEEASIAAEQQGDFEASAEGILHIWLDGPRSLVGRVDGEARALAKEMALAIVRNWPSEVEGDGTAAWPLLPTLGAPTTILLGDLDVTEVLASCPIAAAAIPGCSLVTLPDRVHMPQLEDPAQVAEVLREAFPTGN